MSSYIAIYNPMKESTFRNTEFEIINGEVLSFYGSIISVFILIPIVGSSIWILFVDQKKLEEDQFKDQF